MAIGAIVVRAPVQTPQRDWSSERRRVPKIDSTFAGDIAERGAGFVVGRQGSDLYIATADHVVENASGGAQTIHMSFIGQSTQVFDEAKLVEHDVKLDLAVLRLTAADLAATLADAGRLCYRAVQKDESVTTIGHPLDQLWQVSSVDNVILPRYNNDPRLFTISGKGVAKGSSGGPVLGGDGCLLGLVSRTSAVETVAVSADSIVHLVAPAVDLNLLGGESAITKELRQQTFTSVSTALNSYLFDLEAVAAMFHQQNLDGDYMARTITHYNESYRSMYDGRSAMTVEIGDRFGKQRAADYDALIEWLDGQVHKQVIYSRLTSIVNAFRARGKLTSDENKALQSTLVDLDNRLTEGKARVKVFVDALRAAI
jgi:Trypsin-like peptidase domain